MMAMEAVLARAVPAIWNELPTAFGEAWPAIQNRLWHLLGRMEAGTPEAVDLILALFAAHSEAQRLLESTIAEPVAPLLAKSATRPPAGTIDMGRYVEVPVMFATDRMPVDTGFGDVPGDDTLSMGIARVSIPEDHKMGEFEHPPWWQFHFGWDPRKHIQLLSIQRLESDVFVAQARTNLQRAGRNEVLIFIHGFDVDFSEAARRTAQLAYDLRFEGLALLYSWPSKGRMSEKWYVSDADKIIWTRPRLKQFLELVMSEFGVESVHVIAHSMGNRALTDVLTDIELDELPENAAKLRQIVFTAPDINARTFLDLVDRFHGKAERYTLYASSEDLALKYSKKINKSARAGDAGGFLVLAPGIDTVDVTNVNTSFIGHSLFSDNTSVLADLDILIRHGLPPDERPRLDKKGRGDRTYWVFRA